jgi:hypothetical protein
MLFSDKTPGPRRLGWVTITAGAYRRAGLAENSDFLTLWAAHHDCPLTGSALKCPWGFLKARAIPAMPVNLAKIDLGIKKY